MGYKIEEIEGISTARAAKLAVGGIKTTDQLLAKGTTAAGRKRIAAECGVSPKRLLKWCNMADLMRISGVGEEYSELLEAANCNTVRQLARRPAAAFISGAATGPSAVPSPGLFQRAACHAASCPWPAQLPP